MKKSLLIRWAVILVITISWCWSMFPIKDKDFLAEFKKLANVKQEQLAQQANIAQEKLTNIEKRIEALPKKTGKEYENLLKDREKLNNAYNGYSAQKALEDWTELNRRIDNLMSGKDMDGTELPDGMKYSPYKAVEAAARGNNADLRSIRLSTFIKVPHQAKANNKTVLRYVRRKSAGRLHLGLDLQGGTEFVVSFNKKDIPDNTTAEQVRDQILEILRNRLDKSGVTEPELRGITQTDLSIRMPSIDEGDKTGIRNTIKDTAKLEFYMVASITASWSANSTRIRISTTRPMSSAKRWSRSAMARRPPKCSSSIRPRRPSVASMSRAPSRPLMNMVSGQSPCPSMTAVPRPSVMSLAPISAAVWQLFWMTPFILPR